MITLDPTVTAAPSGALLEYRRFAEALRPGVMRPRLLGALGGAPAEPCHVLDAKYEPGVRAMVLYRLGDRLLRADVSSDDRPRPARSVRVGPGLLVSCYPDDPDLPWLAEAVSAQVLGRELAEALPEVCPLRSRIRVQLLRYRPGKRATMRVTARHTASAGGLPTTFAVKVYHDPRKAAAVAAEGRRLAATHVEGSGLRLAPVLAHVPRLALVVQGWVEGRGLDSVLHAGTLHAGSGEGGDPLEPLARAATSLAALHARPVLSERRRPIEAELARFAQRAARVALVDRDNGALLAGLAQRLGDLHPSLPPARMGLVHGDCKPSQFLLAEQGVALLDLDHCGVADPASDVGTFTASLRQLAIRERLATRSPFARNVASATLSEGFIAAYADAAFGSGSGAREPERALRERVRWYEGAALERKALRAFARAPRSPLPAALVGEAHASLDAAFGEA